MPEYFDTHCHLYYDRYQNDISDVIDSARSNGVTGMLVPGVDEDTSFQASELAARFNGVYAAVGLQPNESPKYPDSYIEKLAELIIEPGVIAIGETGLDYYRTKVSRETQYKHLRQQFELAEKLGYPIILHSRGAEKELMDFLVEREPDMPIIFHCYTGTLETAVRAAEKGYFISFAGPVTFRKEEYLREMARKLPLEQILIETDGPFMSPEPLRGRRNEPAYVRYIADVIADIRKEPAETVTSQLIENSNRALLLGKHRRTDLVYSLNERIYMNITGQCSNRCSFCIKNRQDGIGGYYLQHRCEPDSIRLKNTLDILKPEWGSELVFCGYGEPTMRHSLLGELAQKAGRKGFKTRLNTNGLCLSRISAEKAGAFLRHFDIVSISLNASNEHEYNRTCRPESSEAWKFLHKFVLLAGKTARVRLTAVRNSEIDIEQVKKYAEEMGFSLRVRG